MRSLVRVESALQLGLVLPIAVLLGWLAGAALDRWLHVHWLSVAGLILGAVAGFIEVFRFVAAQGRR
jgi:F0F1-type ATP synthase assembly protein I